MLSNFAQYGAVGLFLMRLAIAAIFIYHGSPKLKKPDQMAAGLGWSSILVRLLGTVEIVASILIILGIYTQLAAIALALIMVGAIYFKVVKWHIPFWAHDNTGWEFDLILLAVALFFLTNL